MSEARDGRLWVPPGHFYSPIPDPDEVARDAPRLFGGLVSELPGVDLGVDLQKRVYDALAPGFDAIELAEAPDPARRYHAANDFFPYCDAFFLTALVRLVRPRRAVEVGSGFSSAAFLDASERWLDGALALRCVEPHPERLLGLLRPEDGARIALDRCRCQDVPLAAFEALAAGDVLFIDSSHVAKTGSDVNFLFFEVLPRLAEGVLVHVHDVPFPFEYDRSVVLEGRAWNEAYLVRAFLQFNDAFKILLHPSAFGAHGEALGRPLPERCRRGGSSSLWLVRGTPPPPLDR